MMNLDLLFNVYKLTGDEKYKNVAVKHAQTTMKNHFRPDYTSYHVVSYNNDGSVEIKQTHQGKNAESAWSRGQAWGVYGYTSCYRETRGHGFPAGSRSHCRHDYGTCKDGRPDSLLGL